MQDYCRQHPARASLIFAIGVFLVVSLTPVWVAWGHSDWESWGTAGSFWQMLWHIPNTARKFGLFAVVFDWYGFEWLKLAMVLIGSAAAIRFLLFLGRKL